MKWLHLSDLHFNPAKDGTDTNNLREKLKDFLIDKNVQVDVLFLTGDYRDASCQADSNEEAQKTVQYIMEIAQIVGVNTPENIFCVPGNHDLCRDIAGREIQICEEKKLYKSEMGVFNSLPNLIDAFTFYKKILRSMYGADYTNSSFSAFKTNPHIIVSLPLCNILSLNTELLAGETVIAADKTQHINDAGTLLLGSNYILALLQYVKRTGTPTIAIGHRGLELLDATEQRKVISLFKDNNVCLYLCGHSHDLWYDEGHGIPQVTVGCIRESEGVKAGFCIGEFRPDDNSLTVHAFSWDNNTWNDYSHFSKAGAMLHLDMPSCESQFPNIIKIVLDGRVRNFRCKVPENGMRHWIQSSNFISTVAGELICTIQNNAYSSAISVGSSFILSDNVWSVIGKDTTVPRVTTLTCKKELKGPYDDFETGISRTNSISNFTIELLAPISGIGVGQTLRFTPMLVRDKKIQKDANIDVQISDCNILEYNKGHIKGTALGESDILVTWNNDHEIISIFHINVTETPVTFTSFRVYKQDMTWDDKSYHDFSVRKTNDVRIGVEKYINGDLVENDGTFSFTVTEKKSGNSIPINYISNHEIKLSSDKMEMCEMYSLSITGDFFCEIEIEVKGWL